jgi:hypothetical protein
VGLVLTVQESGWPFYALVRNMGAPWYMLDINLGGAGIHCTAIWGGGPGTHWIGIWVDPTDDVNTVIHEMVVQPLS